MTPFHFFFSLSGSSFRWNIILILFCPFPCISSWVVLGFGFGFGFFFLLVLFFGGFWVLRGFFGLFIVGVFVGVHLFLQRENQMEKCFDFHSSSTVKLYSILITLNANNY